jgi:hypothetical protein
VDRTGAETCEPRHPADANAIRQLEPCAGNLLWLGALTAKARTDDAGLGGEPDLAFELGFDGAEAGISSSAATASRNSSIRVLHSHVTWRAENRRRAVIATISTMPRDHRGLGRSAPVVTAEERRTARR